LKHPTPPAQLREVLAECRGREWDFERAWEYAVGRMNSAGERIGGRVRFPHATAMRRSWRHALESTIDEWRTAYLGQPSALSVALEQVDLALVDDSSSPAWRTSEPRSAHVALVPLPTPRGSAIPEEFRHLWAAEWTVAGSPLSDALDRRSVAA
jgi:hypothetical protein